MESMANTIEKILERLIICPPTTLPGGCWEWPGRRCKGEYAQISFQGRLKMVYRIVYEHFRGPIPAGQESHHECRNRVCCNPDHLVPLTPAAHRQIPFAPFNPSPNRQKQPRRHCPHGAARVIDCAECHREYGKQRREAKRAASPPARVGPSRSSLLKAEREERERQRLAVRAEAERLAAERRASRRLRQEARAEEQCRIQERREARLHGPCPQGHPRTPENTYVGPSGHRQCRLCRAVQLEKQRALPADAPRRPHRKKTHCLRGHPLEGANLYVSPKGSRFCRECYRLKVERRKPSQTTPP